MLTYKIEKGQEIVFLNIEGKQKKIGVINSECYYKYVGIKHLQRNLRAIGFNKELIESNKFRYVRINYGGKWLMLTTKKILDIGESKKFSHFEQQLFVPLLEFDGYEQLNMKK